MTVFRALFACLLVVLWGCRRDPAAGSPLGSASARSQPPLPMASARGGKDRVHALLEYEHRRDASGITADDLSSRDVTVRRRTARALSRIADDRAAELLNRALADEDPEVVSWAAYGLGYTCRGREPATVRSLAARAASLFATATPPSRFDPIDAVADALSRCGSNEAERMLRSWLELVGPHADSAALALGRLASRHKHLEDTSVVALLDAASRPDRPELAALFAFTRLSGLTSSVEERLHQVALESISKPGPWRAFAIRSLGGAGARGVPKLAEIVASEAFTPSERADAARELGKIGAEAQPALRSALEQLAPASDQATEARLVSAAWGPLITVLDALKPRPRDGRAVLERLAALAVPQAASTALKRRIVTLRCRAAVLLGGDTRVAGCDPDSNGRIGRLAALKLLDRTPITGAGHRRWKLLCESSDPIVRQAALQLITSHPEIPDSPLELAAALGAREDGTVASAAEVIAAYPDRASDSPPAKPGQDKPRDADKPKKNASLPKPDTSAPAPVRPHRAIVQALTKAFDAARAPDAIETRTALLDAVGALGVLSLKRHAQADCTSDNPTLREHAEKSLRLLGERDRRCATFTPVSKAPAELDALLARPVSLEFVLDSGSFRLELDPELAPVAATRIAELAHAGFFKNVIVHRVVPGFVVQFGDPGGDGYGGAGRSPLRCETSPVRFEAGSVGVALAGRDTGSSQIFVTLGAFPHLDGDYAVIGRAEQGWERVAEGDIIESVRFLP